MSKETDVHHVLVIGRGADAAHFCGEACRVLREKGMRVSVVSPDPASVATDPGFADTAYIEPVAPEFVEKIIAKERENGRPVDHLLAAGGGQNELDCAAALAERGVLRRYDVELLDPQMLPTCLDTNAESSVDTSGQAAVEDEVREARSLDEPLLRRAKHAGLPDRRIASVRPELAGEDGVRALRRRLGVRPAFLTTAHASGMPFLRSSYASVPSPAYRADKPAVLIVGAGGQGIEYEHSCVRAAAGFRTAGFAAVLVDSSTETFAAEYDRRYVEPLSLENVLEVYEAEDEIGGVAGVVVQLGGPAAWSLASGLANVGVPLLGGEVDIVDPNGKSSGPAQIIVDALCDGEEFYLGGVMERLGESADAPYALPPSTFARSDVDAVRRSAGAIARSARVRGLVNVRYSRDGKGFHLVGATACASETVPFVSKATGVPLAEAAALLLSGKSIGDLRASGVLPAEGELPAARVAVRETGMGIDDSFGKALAKARNGNLPVGGRVYVSAAGRDRRSLVFPVKRLAELGFEILAGADCAAMLDHHAVPCVWVEEDDVVKDIADGKLALLITTGSGAGERAAEAAFAAGIPCATTLRVAEATVHAIEALIREDFSSVPAPRRPEDSRAVSSG